MIDLQLPCDQCAHRVVCSISPVLERDLAPYRAPELIAPRPGITVAASITVDCEYFLASEAIGPRLVVVDPDVAPVVKLATEHVSVAVLAEVLESPAPEVVADVHRPFTTSQQAWVDAMRANKGDLAATARGFGWKRPGALHAFVKQIRADGRMPADLEALLRGPVVLTVERLAELGHGPKSPTGKAMVACEDCGGQFAKGPGIALHRKSHQVKSMMRTTRDEATQRIQDAEAAAVRAVAERARQAPVDVIGEREADESKHRERARAKAAETWARRHGGERLS